MWLNRVVVAPSPLDDDLRLAQAEEDPSVQDLISQSLAKHLIGAIFLSVLRHDDERHHADPGKPCSDRLGGKIRAIARREGFSVEAMTKHQPTPRDAALGAIDIAKQSTYS